MYLRIYTVNQKYVKNRYGDIGVYRKKIKKWIRSNRPYKPQKRGFEKQSVFSKRFGFLELYNRKEQQDLIFLLDIVSVSVSMFCAKCGMDITKQGVMKKVVEEW